jgi:hypothetical protein
VTQIRAQDLVLGLELRELPATALAFGLDLVELAPTLLALLLDLATRGGADRLGLCFGPSAKLVGLLDGKVEYLRDARANCGVHLSFELGLCGSRAPLGFGGSLALVGLRGAGALYGVCCCRVVPPLRGSGPFLGFGRDATQTIYVVVDLLAVIPA